MVAPNIGLQLTGLTRRYQEQVDSKGVRGNELD